MAETVRKSARLFIGVYDVSGRQNSLDLDYGCEMKDRTMFTAASREKLSGLRDVTIRHTGYWGSSEYDLRQYEAIGSSEQVLSVCPTSGVAGARAYACKSVYGEYTLGGTIGDLVSFTMAANGAGPLVRGQVSIASSESLTSTAGSTTPANLGVGSATQRIYASVHILSSTCKITLDIIRSSSSGFSTGTTHLSFSSSTGTLAEFKTTKASTTMGFYKARWSCILNSSGQAFGVVGIK